MKWLRNINRTIKWTGRILMKRATLPTLPADATNERGILEVDGARIYYVIQGAGQPVVLVHGYGVSASINWKMPGILPELARDFRVIAMDVRGHGRSDKPHDVGQYGTKMADDVQRLMDHLQLPQAHLVGYSMGGFILLNLLVSHPERFLSATLGGSGGIRPTWPLWSWSEELASLLDQGMDYPQANIAAAATALHRPLTGLEKALIRSLPDSNDPLAMSAVIKSWRDLQVTDDQLHDNCTPTLLVYGTAEFPGMVEYIQQLGTVLPKATLHAISGTNHFDTVLCPEFLQAVKDFLIRRAQACSATCVAYQELVPHKIVMSVILLVSLCRISHEV